MDDEEFKNTVTKKGGKNDGIVPSQKRKPTPQVQSKGTPTGKSSAPEGKASSKFTNILLQAMEANNIDGFDYLEYKQSLHNLAKMPMDEQTRYQSAFAAASTMGATPKKLIDTANFYIGILKKEENKFGQALANQKDKQIGDKTQLINQHDNLVKEKTAQIERLKKEIADHAAKAKQMRTTISQATIKVETTKNNFVASYNLVLSQINRDIENMKKYLK